MPLKELQLAYESIRDREQEQVEEVAVAAHIPKEEHRRQSLDMALAEHD